MARIDHARTNSAERMRRQGTDCIADCGIPGGLQPPRPRQSKAALRADLAAAMASVTRIVKCRCGHQAAIALPPAKLRAKLRCSKCGSIAQIEKPAGAASGGLHAELTTERPTK